MPTYEYSCKACGIHFDKTFRFKDNHPEVTCPNGHHQTRRIFTSPNIVYKGSGFYSTDHQKIGSKTRGKSV
jgi:putative FmdB family regulatory protein